MYELCIKLFLKFKHFDVVKIIGEPIGSLQC